MISIHVKVDTAGVDKAMLNGQRNQIPFAQAVAINEVAKIAQKEQRAHNRKVFKVRRASFVDNSVKITHFAKKYVGKTFAEIAIASPGGRSDILGKFEDGGMKRPRGKSITVPDSVKRTKADVVSRANRPKAMNFKLHGKGPKATVYVGDKRTFMIQRPDGTGAIYQRFRSTQKRTHLGGIAGRARRSRDTATRTLFTLTPDARIRPVLNFVKNVTKAVTLNWSAEFRKAFAAAMRTAR